MKQSNTLSRTILSLFALAAFGCSPLVSSQPGVPPIEMTIEQFNQGRPADFYYLADASQGYEAVCAEVLAALNEPYPGEPYAEYNEPYSKYLLRSRLSVSWFEKARLLPNGARYDYDIRHAIVDLTNDGIDEDLILAISSRSGFIIHTLGFFDGDERLNAFHEMDSEITQKLILSNSFDKGRAIVDGIGSILREKYEDYDPYNPDRLSVGDPLLDVMEFEGRNYLLFTNARLWEERRDALLLEVSQSLETALGCRFSARFRLVN